MLRCHACNAWEYSQLAIDLENASVCFGENEEIHSLISRDKKGSTEFPIPETPLKGWEVEEGFKITHIGSEEKSMRYFFSHPLPRPTRFPVPIAPIEKEAQLIRGSSLNRGVYRFKPDKSKNEAILENIIARLNDIGIAMRRNYIPLEKQNDWIKTNPELNGEPILGYEFEYKEGDSTESKVIDSIKMNYPAFQAMTYLQIFNENIVDAHPQRHMIKYQLWKNNKNDQFLLIQTDWDTGAASNINHGGDLHVFSAIDGQYRHICLSQEESLSNHLYLRTDAGGIVRNELKSFFSEGNMLLISDTDDFSIIVFDAAKQKVQATFSDIPEAQDLHSLHLSENGRFCLQINQGGRFYFYDTLTQQRALSGLYVDDELVLYTDDGFYDGTSEGARYVTWHYPGLQQHFDFSQFESQFKRPDIIKSILTGQQVQKPAIQFVPPPTVNMTLNHPGNYSKAATIELSATSSPMSET